MTNYSFAEMHQCLMRELGKRAGRRDDNNPDAYGGVYGALVKAGKMKHEDALREIKLMRSCAEIIEIFKAVDKGGFFAFQVFKNAADRDNLIAFCQHEKRADEFHAVGVIG